MTLNALETLIDTSTSGHDQTVVADACCLIANRYRLLRPLGEGGMGNVYLADDVLLARQVAVKTIRPELSGNEEVRSRIKRECRMHAAIGVHPHIITLYDTVEENGHIYLVMEFFAGQTLAERLAAPAETPGLPLKEALDVIRQLLQALACIHDRDIVHRDIKTSNILLHLLADGRYAVKLTDFGIARPEAECSDLTRLTSVGTQGPGTPVYMAPERIDPHQFGEISPATDLYAVGIILYELLTGTPPFQGSMTEIFSGHLLQQPAFSDLPLAIPAALEATLRKALAKEPANRYQDAASFLDALALIDEGHNMLSSVATQHTATLLATENPSGAIPSCETTMLDPALGLGTTRRAINHKWLYLAAALLGLLIGLLMHSRSTREPSLSDHPAEVTAAPTTSTPGVGQSSDTQTPEKTNSALQTVENSRQQKSPEPSQPTDRNTNGTSDSQGWRIIEKHSRKIH